MGSQHNKPNTIGVVCSGHPRSRPSHKVRLRTVPQKSIITSPALRFDIASDPFSLHIVFLNKRWLVKDSTWPAFTLWGQSIVSINHTWRRSPIGSLVSSSTPWLLCTHRGMDMLRAGQHHPNPLQPVYTQTQTYAIFYYSLATFPSTARPRTASPSSMQGGAVALFPSYREPRIVQVKDGVSLASLEFSNWLKKKPRKDPRTPRLRYSYGHGVSTPTSQSTAAALLSNSDRPSHLKST